MFVGGLQLASEQKEDSYHFLVFTDLFGNRTHGVVLQSYRAVQVQTPSNCDGLLALNELKTCRVNPVNADSCFSFLCQSTHEGVVQNGHRWNSSKTRLYAPFAVCVISKFPYYNALRDCLSW